eukprot:5749128-Pyramimonas_sp.AAC.1
MQPVWCNICGELGAIHVVQYAWLNCILCCAIHVVQAAWCNSCGATSVVQSMVGNVGCAFYVVHLCYASYVAHHTWCNVSCTVVNSLCCATRVVPPMLCNLFGAVYLEL